MKDEIKACLISSFEVSLDPYLAGHGFTRRNKSLVFKRKYQSSMQSIDVSVQIYPKDNQTASAAVYPIMEVQVPIVDELLRKMIGDSFALMEGVTKGLSNQPIEFTAEKSEKARWFVYQADSVPVVVLNIRSFIDKWTMPFLDVYATPEQIVEADERGDGRMVEDRAHTMRVVAAALVCNRRDYAMDIMEKRLGSIGARSRYQKIFDYISVNK